MLCPCRVFVMCVFRLPYLEIHRKVNEYSSIRKIFRKENFIQLFYIVVFDNAADVDCRNIPVKILWDANIRFERTFGQRT